ncbi:uncharacterized protein V1513DRAFT_459489 [Lipomyces chichibuensis]|uniref:uncharacterized protein n=1 Tax=Lipomyces chichibuensis TaxID=1546026 RepID=UPI003342FE4B
MTDEVRNRNYIKSHKYLPLLMTNPSFEQAEAHIITRKYVDDFKSAQLLVAEQDGYELLQGLQEPGISLAILASYFTDSQKFNRAKMTPRSEPNKHGIELSLPLSYLLLDTRGIQETGKRGSRLTTWLMELRNAGLKPKWVHTDKDFADIKQVTAASLAFGRNNDGYNHHFCLWHSLRAVSQNISGKAEGRVGDSLSLFYFHGYVGHILHSACSIPSGRR